MSFLLISAAQSWACIVEWSEVREPRGVFLLVHGLNNPPVVMRPLGEILNQRGFSTALVGLTGHTDVTAEVAPSREQWRADIDCAVAEVRARFPGHPLGALGFSLGGAAILDSIRTVGESPFDRLILIAPAVGLKGYTALMRIAAWFQWSGLAVPSFIPAEYRSARFTPLTGYAALFDIVDALITRPPLEVLRRIPTLIVMNDGDEFISVSRTRRFVSEGALSGWQLLVLPERGLSTPNHLMVDENTFGRENWRRTIETIRRFIAPP